MDQDDIRPGPRLLAARSGRDAASLSGTHRGIGRRSDEQNAVRSDGHPAAADSLDEVRRRDRQGAWQ